MKLFYEANGEQHIIITDCDNHEMDEMFDYFLRLMISAGYTPDDINGILSDEEL